MKAQCIICPAIVESQPDPVFDEGRTQREMGTIGAAMMDHLHTVHKPLADLFLAETMKLFSLAGFSQFKSDDHRFKEVVASMHEEIKHLVNTKITPGAKPPRTDKPLVRTENKMPDSWDKLKLKG